MVDLTKRQQEIFEFIKRYSARYGYPPTVRDIGKAVGLASSSTVHAHLANLEKVGLLRRDPTKPRAIELLDRAVDGVRNIVRPAGLPLVGQVAAGQPVLAEENIEDYVAAPAVAGGEDGEYVLRIRGESMKDAGILEGDLVASGDGRHDEEAAPIAERPGGQHDLGCIMGRVHLMGDRQPASARPERRKAAAVRAEPDDRDAERLEPLQRARQVEERLGPGAHGDHRMAGQGGEVGALVAGLRPVAMDAADAAGGEHLDAGRRRQRQRCRYGGGGRRPPLCHCHGEVALAHLAVGREDPGKFPVVDTHPGDAVQHDGQRRDRPTAHDRVVDTLAGLGAGWPGESQPAEDRGLQGHDGLPSGQRRGDARRNPYSGAHGGIVRAH